MIETEISLFTPPMGNRYLPHQYLKRTVYRLQSTNVMDGAVRVLTDDTKKFVKDAQDHYFFTVKPVAINIPYF